MKSLNEYLNTSEQVLFESVLDNTMSIDECYDRIYDAMFGVNEGLFSKIGSKLKAWGEKAAASGDALDAKVDKLSDSAKAAVDRAKEKAGKAWDKMGDAYTSVVAAVDNAVQQSKEAVSKMADTAKIKIEDFESACSQVYSNAIAKGGKLADEMGAWVSDKTQGVQKMAAVNALLLGAMMVKRAGIDSSMAIDILSAAGL